MKKFISVLALACVAVLPAAAGDIFDSGDNEAYFGARFSLDISCPSKYDIGGVSFGGFGNGAGFEAGAVYNIPLWKNLYFEPGLLLYYSTMKDKVYVQDDGYGNFKDSSARIRRFGFRVPLRAGYSFDFDIVKVSVFTGPRLSLPIVGREKLSVETPAGKESDSFNIYGDKSSFRRMDIGWQFGASVTYDRFVFEISGTPGMLDMIKGPGRMHDNSVDITLGYNF